MVATRSANRDVHRAISLRQICLSPALIIHVHVFADLSTRIVEVLILEARQTALSIIKATSQATSEQRIIGQLSHLSRHKGCIHSGAKQKHTALQLEVAILFQASRGPNRSATANIAR